MRRKDKIEHALEEKYGDTITMDEILIEAEYVHKYLRMMAGNREKGERCQSKNSWIGLTRDINR